MMTEQRKSRRQTLHYNARIFTAPKQSLGCVLSDVSDVGARLKVDDPGQLPDRFLLLLSARGTPRRVCQVVWRNEQQVGVKFEYRGAQADQGSPRAKVPEAAR